MKNKYSLIILVLTLSYFGIGQTIPNSGFELWSVQGPNESPDDWIWAPSIIKSNDAHSGMFAVEIEAGEFTNPQNGQTIPVPGRLVPGLDGGGMGASGTEGFAFTETPDSLTGWYKYAPNGNDVCFINVSLSKWNAVTNTREIIAEGTFSSIGSVAYEAFSLPLQYTTSEIPDTCLIELLSSDVQSGIQGSILLVDDLEFVTSTASNFELGAEPMLSVFPNPASHNLQVEFGGNFEQAKIVITDLNGILVGSEVLSVEKSIDVSLLSDGIYIVHFITDEKSYQQKFIKH